MALTAMGLGVGLTVDIALARLVGATAVTDQIVIVLTIPFIADTIIREGARYSLISILHDLEERDELIHAQVIALAIVASTVTFLLARLVFALLSSSIFLPSDIALLSSLTAAFFAIAAVLMAISDSKGIFFLSSGRNLIVHGSALITFLIGVKYDVEPLEAIVRGYLAGAIGSCVVTTYLVSRAVRSIRPTLPQSSLLQLLRQRVVPAVANVGSGQIIRASERGSLLLAASGSVFMFYISFRIFASLQSLVGGTLATIHMKADRAAASSLRDYRKVLARQAVVTGAYVVPIAILLIILSEHAVRLVYGERLSSSDLETVAKSLSLFAGALYFQTLNVLVGTLWYVQRRVFLMNVASFGVAIVAVPALYFIAPRYGVLGVTMISCLVSIGTLLANILLMEREFSLIRKKLGGQG